MPYDSDPGFYKDHYDREVSARTKLAEKGSLQGAEQGKGSDRKSDGGDRKLLRKEFNVRSGFTETTEDRTGPTDPR